MKTVLLLALLVQDKPALFSGPQKGEALPGFTIVDVTGPSAGKEIDPVAEFKGAPTLLVFIHRVNRPGARLLREIDRAAQDRTDFGLKTQFVMLGEDRFEREKYLPIFQRALGIRMPAGVSVDGAEGPGPYGLNKEVELTLLVARDGKVTYNLALIDPNETFLAAVEREIDAALGPPPALSAEEAAREVRRLQLEVRRLKRELDELRQRHTPPQQMERRRDR